MPDATSIGKEELIKQMMNYKSGAEAALLRGYLELKKPFTRFNTGDSERREENIGEITDQGEDELDGSDGSDESDGEATYTTGSGGFLGLADSGCDSGCDTDGQSRRNTLRTHITTGDVDYNTERVKVQRMDYLGNPYSRRY